jgi:hypothetical protein
MVKVHCNQSYRNRPHSLEFEAGHHYDVTEDVFDFVQRDSHGTFTIVKPTAEKHAPRDYTPGEPVIESQTEGILPSVEGEAEIKEDEAYTTALDEPPHDTAIKKARKRKAA